MTYHLLLQLHLLELLISIVCLFQLIQKPTYPQLNLMVLHY